MKLQEEVLANWLNLITALVPPTRDTAYSNARKPGDHIKKDIQLKIITKNIFNTIKKES